jgi:hypothetical protein
MARLHVGGGADVCCAPTAPVKEVCKNEGFLLLLLLFILLAAGPVWGIDNNFFFIIILAIIGFGGFGRTFGFGGTVF